MGYAPDPPHDLSFQHVCRPWYTARDGSGRVGINKFTEIRTGLNVEILAAGIFLQLPPGLTDASGSL